LSSGCYCPAEASLQGSSTISGCRQQQAALLLALQDGGELSTAGRDMRADSEAVALQLALRLLLPQLRVVLAVGQALQQ
jgi:hypothetical protein